jgi:hypothetical protein
MNGPDVAPPTVMELLLIMPILLCVTRKKSAAAAITMVCYYVAHWQSTKGSNILMAAIYNKKKAERKWK